MDEPGMLAPQASVNRILIPSALGWGLQIFLAGVATTRALPWLYRSAPRPRGISQCRTLLALAVLSNLFVTFATQWELSLYLISQERTLAVMRSFRTPDFLLPISYGLTSAFTQTFMAIRCSKIIGGHRIFTCVMAIGISASLGTAACGTISEILFARGIIAGGMIFYSAQIWSWSNVIVDLLITAVLCTNLARYRAGKKSTVKTDYLLESLIRVAFGTCALPFLASAVSATILAVTSRTNPDWDAGFLVNAFTAYIPSLYILSFVYCIEASLRSMAGVPKMVGTSLEAAEQPDSLGRQRIHGWLPDMPYRKTDDVCVEGGQQQHEATKLAPSCTGLGLSRDMRHSPAQLFEVSIEGLGSGSRAKDSFSSDWPAPPIWRTTQTLHEEWAATEQGIGEVGGQAVAEGKADAGSGSY